MIQFVSLEYGFVLKSYQLRGLWELQHVLANLDAYLW